MEVQIMDSFAPTKFQKLPWQTSWFVIKNSGFMQWNYPFISTLRRPQLRSKNGYSISWKRDSSGLISLCRGDEKDWFIEVNVTLFNTKNLSSSYSCFYCKCNDAMVFCTRTLKKPLSIYRFRSIPICSSGWTSGRSIVLRILHIKCVVRMRESKIRFVSSWHPSIMW